MLKNFDELLKECEDSGVEGRLLQNKVWITAEVKVQRVVEDVLKNWPEYARKYDCVEEFGQFVSRFKDEVTPCSFHWFDVTPLRMKAWLPDSVRQCIADECLLSEAENAWGINGGLDRLIDESLARVCLLESNYVAWQQGKLWLPEKALEQVGDRFDDSLEMFSSVLDWEYDWVLPEGFNGELPIAGETALKERFGLDPDCGMCHRKDQGADVDKDSTVWDKVKNPVYADKSAFMEMDLGILEGSSGGASIDLTAMELGPEFVVPGIDPPIGLEEMCLF